MDIYDAFVFSLYICKDFHACFEDDDGTWNLVTHGLFDQYFISITNLVLV